jgi:tetratricopeptide (TPR) repeat protein
MFPFAQPFPKVSVSDRPNARVSPGPGVGLAGRSSVSMSLIISSSRIRRTLLVLALTAVSPLSAQQQEVDQDLRTGLILARDGKLDSALVYLARARAAHPEDTETRLAQARVMSWKQRYADAIAGYDSLLTEQPGLPDALLGKAQVNAWQGRLDEAKRGYQAVLTQNPRYVDALVGLGYVYHWQGREERAERLTRAALAIDSTHQGARDLLRSLGDAGSGLDAAAIWNNDSDDNTAFGQTLRATVAFGSGVDAFGSVNALEARDHSLDVTRYGGEAGLSLALGSLQISGAAGGRRLNPEVAPARTSATYWAQLRFRPVPAFGLGVGYSRAPFDEIASLIERGLDLEVVEAGADVSPLPQLTISGGGNVLWLNDGNRRTGASAGLTQRIRRHFFVGTQGRTLTYRRRDPGYFSPDRFSVLEGVGGWNLEGSAWIAGLSGGLGAQKIGRQGAARTEWHLEGRMGQRWGRGNRIELFGLVTNSAGSSTTGAFRYRSAGLTVRLGL